MLYILELGLEIFLEHTRLTSYLVVVYSDNASGARLLTHFYTFLFLQDWKHDLWLKRFVRDQSEKSLER